MDVKRVHEIINSPSNIEVLHNGSLVWLEKVSDNTGKVDIINLDTNKHMNIPSEELRETGRVEPYTTS